MIMGAMTQMANCTHCGKAYNIRLSICPFCGGEKSFDEGVCVSPQCPRCHKVLDLHTQEGEEYNICPQCSGLWLDRREFRRATRESDVFRKENLANGSFHPPLPEAVAYIPCVRCRKMMNRKNFARISGVLIDECGRHGVWLDAGELEKIRLFIADGGLERAQDKEIEKNRLQIEGLATKVDQAAFVNKLIHFWNFKRWLFGG